VSIESDAPENDASLPPPSPGPSLLEGRHLPLLRAGVDLAMLVLATALALLWAHAARSDTSAQALLYGFPPLTLLLLYLRGRYRQRMRLLVLDEIALLVGTVSVATMAVITLALVATPSPAPGPLVARAWLLGALLLVAGRAAVAWLQRRRRLRSAAGRPALIVGAGLMGRHAARRLLNHPEYGLSPVGFLDGYRPELGAQLDRRTPILGNPEDLRTVAEDTGAQTVIIAFIAGADRQLVPLVRACHSLGLEILIIPRLFDAFNQRTALEHLGGLPLLAVRQADPRGWEFAVKHAIDRAGAALILLVISPLLLAITAAIRLTSPGPVLFRQRRVGRDCEPFDLLKFRSMRMADQDHQPFQPQAGSAPGGVEGVDRRTRVGRFLRRTSLDELPQLFNVLKGEMSLIGPRPERSRFVELFEEEISRYGERHRVKSGMTGWAQVHGLRGQTSIADRAEWDNYYIENWSLKLDFMILALTLRAVFAREEG